MIKEAMRPKRKKKKEREKDTRFNVSNGNGMERNKNGDRDDRLSFVDSFIIDWLLLLLQIILLRVRHRNDEQPYYDYRIILFFFFFFFPSYVPLIFFIFVFGSMPYHVFEMPEIENGWESVIAQHAMYDAMWRCFDVSCLRSRSSIEVLGMIFFFFHIECTKECVSAPYLYVPYEYISPSRHFLSRRIHDFYLLCILYILLLLYFAMNVT